MNLFEISGKITLDGDGAISAINSVTSAAKSAASALAGIAGAGLKVGGAVAGGVATAGAAIVKSAVTNYAQAEQLVGGIKTLFKDSAPKVQAYAAEAFQTAGLSSNQYMETAMGFSASLRQSLNGDTDAMAEYANMAVIDMADNANKMGTDMASIQNAYQGFAKQNYTMLDNLKLGYGGTKGEMQRLIEDANDLKEAMGETGDLSIDSFADVVEAIHLVQDELGITGATADEAATTITGSTASMKAAWSNLMTGVADENADMDKLVDDFVDAGVTAASNVVPRVATAIRGTMQLGQTLVPAILDQFETYKPQLQEGFYSLVTDGLNFAGFDVEQTDVQGTFESIFGSISGLGESLKTSFGNVYNPIKTIVSDIAGTLSENGVTIEGVFEGIGNAAELVSEPVGAALDAIGSIAIPLVDWATTDGTIIHEAFENLKTSAEGFSGALTNAFEGISQLTSGNFDGAKISFDGLFDGLQESASTGIANTMNFLTGKVSEISSLFDVEIKFPEINTQTVSTAMTAVQGLSKTMAEILNVNLAFPTIKTDAVGEAVSGVFEALNPLKEAFHFSWGLPKVNVDALSELPGAVGEIVSSVKEMFNIDLKLPKPSIDSGILNLPSREDFGNYEDFATARMEWLSTTISTIVSGKAITFQAPDTSSAEEAADRLNNKVVSPKFDMGDDLAKAEAMYGGVAQEIDSLNGQSATANVDVEGAESAKEAVSSTANAIADLTGIGTVALKVDTSDLSQATAQASQTAAAIQSAFEFSLATPAVDTSSFGDAVAAASVAAAAIQAAFASISISIPAPSIGGGGAGGGVSATSAGGGTPAVAAAGVEGYASGAVLLKPTEFGFNPYTNNRMIAGEAGPEAIAPISTLQSYVGEAVAERDAEQGAQLAAISAKLDRLDDLIDVASQMTGMSLKVNGREFGRLVKQTK